MKRLILLRHAKSDREKRKMSDFERPLNHRGRLNAPDMGKRLKKAEIIPDLIVTSPANRALTTARLVADEIGYPRENLLIKDKVYEAWTEDLYRVIEEFPDSCETILLVGHNPGLQILAEEISGFDEENLPTCGIIGIDLNINTWNRIKERKGKVFLYDFPRSNSAL